MRNAIPSLIVLLVATTVTATHAATTRFRAALSADFVQPQTDPDHSQSTATGTADFVLEYDPSDPAATRLTYEVAFAGLDVAPSDGENLLDDITALHFHDTTACANASLCGDGLGGKLPGSTAGTRHVLNVLGMPRVDDADLQVFADEERITGVWDPSDANTLSPAPSQSIADPEILDLLFAGKLAVMVHTNLVSSGEIGGAILPVPEPSAVLLLVLGATVAMHGTGRPPRTSCDR